MKNALILCAGSARRFYPNGDSRPKCLLPITQDKTILDGLIQPLIERGYNIILGTGSGHEDVAQHAREYSDVRCIFNRDYATTNSIVTLWQLRDFVGDQTLLVNGDLVVDATAFDCFTDEANPQILVKQVESFDDDSYRVCFDDDYVVQRMGKELLDAPSAHCLAFTGISRIGCSDLFLAEIEKLLGSGVRDTWPTTAYRNLIGTAPVRARDIGEVPYFDVDTPEEHAAAQQVFGSMQHSMQQQQLP